MTGTRIASTRCHNVCRHKFAARCTTLQGRLAVISTRRNSSATAGIFFVDYIHLAVNMLCFCFRALPKLWAAGAARSRTPVSLPGTERRSPRKGAGSDMAADLVAVAPFTVLHKQSSRREW